MQTTPSPPPKGANPAPLSKARIPAPSGFWLNHAVPGDQEGGGGTIIVPHPKLSAKAMPPLWQYFSRSAGKKGKRVHCYPQRTRTPGTPCGFSPATGRFQGTAGRGHDRHRGPPASRRRDGGRGAMPRCGSTSLACERRRRVHYGPQRARTPGPCGISPANRPFLGTAGRDHHRLLGPCEADAVMVGEGHAPLRQYFSRLQRRRQTSASPPPKELDPPAP
jgi:hypothetical protein